MRNASRGQIHRDTWLEFSTLCERTIKSLGLVGHLWELSGDGTRAEQERCRMVIQALSKEGQVALKKFGKLWSDLNGQVMGHSGLNASKNFDGTLRGAGSHRRGKNHGHHSRN